MLESFYFQTPESMSRAWPALMWSFGIRKARTLAIEAGVGMLPETIARTLDVRLNEPALHVAVETDKVEVHLRDEILRADFAIIATTASAAHRLHDSSDELEKALMSTPYSQTTLLSVAARRAEGDVSASPPFYGLLIPRTVRVDVAAVGLETMKCADRAPHGELLSVMLSDASSRRLMQLDGESILESVSEELYRHLPVERHSLRLLNVVRWPEAMPLSPIGRSRDIHRYRLAATDGRRLYLAGDYLSGPCTEGAVESGHWAADAVLSSIR